MRLALGVAYRGSGYLGWQIQPEGLTVQGCLEHALSVFADEPVKTLCAGRTDTGVHGLNQVVHLDTELDRRDFSWVRGTNRYLPPDIAVQWCVPVPETFHARNSAVSRRYAYVLLESVVRPALETGQVGWAFRPLNAAAMRTAVGHLLGEHDFSSFRAAQCQARSPVKRLYGIGISSRGPYWRFDFHGNAFLHHMIRNIMGCLVAIGCGARPPGWMGEVLAARDRAAAAPTFSPDGLYFLGPEYDASLNLPVSTPALHWLPIS